MSAALIHGLNHPIRRMILRRLSKEGASESPSEMASFSGSALPAVAHHSRMLRDLGILRVTKIHNPGSWERKVYASNVADNPLVKEILSDTEDEDDSLLRSDEPGQV